MLLIPSFVLIVFWIILTIYHNSVASTITPTQSIQIKPINADFDSKTINDIKNREQVAPLFEINNPTESEKPASSEAIPEPVLTIIPASQGGSL